MKKKSCSLNKQQLVKNKNKQLKVRLLQLQWLLRKKKMIKFRKFKPYKRSQKQMRPKRRIRLRRKAKCEMILMMITILNLKN